MLTQQSKFAAERHAWEDITLFWPSARGVISHIFTPGAPKTHHPGACSVFLYVTRERREVSVHEERAREIERRRTRTFFGNTTTHRAHLTDSLMFMRLLEIAIWNNRALFGKLSASSTSAISRVSTKNEASTTDAAS